MKHQWLHTLCMRHTGLLAIEIAEKCFPFQHRGEVYCLTWMRLLCLLIDLLRWSKATIYDPCCSSLGIVTNKGSKCTRMINSSTVAQEALPPHFKFSIDAQSPDQIRHWIEMTAFMHGKRKCHGHCLLEWMLRINIYAIIFYIGCCWQ